MFKPREIHTVTQKSGALRQVAAISKDREVGEQGYI